MGWKKEGERREGEERVQKTPGPKTVMKRNPDYHEKLYKLLLTNMLHLLSKQGCCLYYDTCYMESWNEYLE